MVRLRQTWSSAVCTVLLLLGVLVAGIAKAAPELPSPLTVDQTASIALWPAVTLRHDPGHQLTIGYALAPLDSHNADDLLKGADAAMYAGKRAGRRRVTGGGRSAVSMA